MTGLSQPGMSLEHLIDYAHSEGIRVWWRRLPGRDGQWSAEHQSIWISPDLTAAEARSVLAHELGHAALGHDGPQPSRHEAQAWRWAVRVLIHPDAYRAAEALHGPCLVAIAEELGVTPHVVTTYQGTLEAAA